MKYLMLTIVLSGIITASCGNAHGNFEANANYLTVIYADFDVDPIAGYHAKDLERAGCKYKISRKDLKSAILSRVGREQFDQLNLKAEIVDNGRTMYIDDGGVLKNSSGFFLIDKGKFEHALVPTQKCKI